MRFPRYPRTRGFLILLGLLLSVALYVAYAKLSFRWQYQCLHEAMFFEALGEGQDGRAAVAQVIFNRTKQAGRWPATVCGVVNQYAVVKGRTIYQFSYHERSDQPQHIQRFLKHWHQIKHEARALLTDWQRHDRNYRVSAAVRHRVGDADHYVACWLRQQPGWVYRLRVNVRVGRHWFLAGKVRPSSQTTRATSSFSCRAPFPLLEPPKQKDALRGGFLHIWLSAWPTE